MEPPLSLQVRAATSPGVRQAALLLHTLEGLDRDWMLSQLPTDQQAEMHALLDELAELGVPADKGLLSEVLESSVGSPLAEPVDDSEGGRLVHQLQQLPAKAVAVLLQPEPDRFIAQVLRLGAWPWRDALLEHLGPTRRRRIHELAETADGAGTLKERSTRDLAVLDVLWVRASRGLGAPRSARPVGQPRSLMDTLGSWAQRLQGSFKR